MSPEEQNKLNRALELAEENNRLIKKLVRAARWARLFRFIYLLIIVGASVGILYVLQPYLEQILETYGGIRDSVNSFGGALR
ncbi:MAG TPA: hypothetical protein VGA94_01695 [Thermodesulfobacteriota bacterium]|jgi:hypothetical protein